MIQTIKKFIFSPAIHDVYFGNKVSDYLIAIAIFFIMLFIVVIIDKLLINYLKNAAKKTDFKIDNFLINNIEKTIIPVLYFSTLYISIISLHINEAILKIVNSTAVFLITFYAIRLAVNFLSYFLQDYLLGFDKEESKKKSLKGLLVILKIAVWSIGLVFLLDNLGYKISTVVAGLGIGGIAVALAAQAILGDLFSYFVILFDKPFEVGDHITIDTKTGIVEKIGLKTTRLKTNKGEMLIVSNSNLTNSKILNYKKMEIKKIEFKLVIEGSTNFAHLKDLSKLLKDIILSEDHITYEKSSLSGINDSGIIFEVIYFIETGDFMKFTEIVENVNLKIIKLLREKNIKLAYPTRTVYLNDSNFNKAGL